MRTVQIWYEQFSSESKPDKLQIMWPRNQQFYNSYNMPLVLSVDSQKVQFLHPDFVPDGDVPNCERPLLV
jgi:hypothetical protein